MAIIPTQACYASQWELVQTNETPHFFLKIDELQINACQRYYTWKCFKWTYKEKTISMFDKEK